MKEKTWCYKFQLPRLGFSGEYFPVEEYRITDNFLIVQKNPKSEEAIGCIMERGDDKKAREIYRRGLKEQYMFNFVAIYNLFTPVPVEFNQLGYGEINEEKKMREQLHFIKLTGSVLYTHEQQERAQKEILQHLEQAKLIWNYFIKLPDNNLKKNILNALAYYFYAKKAERLEERIVNIITALECLFIESNVELGYKLSLRSSYLISHYIKDDDGKKIFKFTKDMYDIRSTIVHQGTSKKEIKTEDVFKLFGLSTICIRSFLILNKTCTDKQQVINYLEDGLFGKKIELPNLNKLPT